MQIKKYLWDAKKVSVTVADRLRECKNTEFVAGRWEKLRFVKVAVSGAFRLRECPLEELPHAYKNYICIRLALNGHPL